MVRPLVVGIAHPFVVRLTVVGAVVGAVGVVGPVRVAVLALSRYYGASGCGCSRLNDTKMTIHNIEQAVVHYQVDHADACPLSLQALVGERYFARPPLDRWGQSLAFTCPARYDFEGADVTSAGPDRRFGTADDIRSWDM